MGILQNNKLWKRRALSALCALALPLALCFFSPRRARAQDAPGTDALRFDESGRFTILLLADLQDTQWTVPYLLSSVNSVLEEYTPDFIVLLGDQLEGSSPIMRIGNGRENTALAIDKLMQPIVSRGIPFAVVFGNHDGEAPLTKEEQMALYQSYAHCLAQDEGDALPGCGTYVLPVYGADGEASSSPLLNLFFFDSGGYAPDSGYPCVSAEQVAWYEAESARFRADNLNQTVPAAAFQHIVAAEIYDALDEAEKGASGAFEGVGYGEGRYFLAASSGVLAGEVSEAPCPSRANCGQFSAFARQGDVFAAFFGHDHVNTYLVGHEGIDLVAAPGATYTSYNDRAVRGVRLLRFHEENVRDYETLLVPFHQYESFSLFDVIPYYLLCSTRLYNAVKLCLLALIIVGGLAGIVLLDRKQKKRRAAAEDAGEACPAANKAQALTPDGPADGGEAEKPASPKL